MSSFPCKLHGVVGVGHNQVHFILQGFFTAWHLLCAQALQKHWRMNYIVPDVEQVLNR